MDDPTLVLARNSDPDALASSIRRWTLVLAAVLLFGGGGGAVLASGSIGEAESLAASPPPVSGLQPRALVPATDDPDEEELDEEAEDGDTPAPGGGSGTSPGSAAAGPSAARSARVTPSPVPTPTPPPPVIAGVSASPTQITTKECQPAFSQITARVWEERASAVTLHWSVGGSAGAHSMQRSAGGRVASLGSFGANMVPPGQSTVPVRVTVEVFTTDGQTFTEGLTVTLRRCGA
jgi:hypothetical protein